MAIKNEDLKFGDIAFDSKFLYLWSMLDTLISMGDDSELRNIVLNFIWKFQDFCNERDYSVEYYDKLVWMDKNMDLDEEQKRILYLTISEYKNRWIDLPVEKQNKKKELNKKLVELWEKYKNNLKDEQSEFSYYIPDDSCIKDLPKSILEKTKIAAWERWWYLFDADPNSLIDLIRYCTDPQIRKEISDIRNLWASKWKYDNREIVLQFLKLND